MTAKHASISAIILNYQATEADLDRCVASVEKSDAPGLFEILIVDNGSKLHRCAVDEVAARHARARAVHLTENFGFAGGINRGVREATGELVMILNNDTVVERAAIRRCAEVLSDQPASCVGVAPKILLRRQPNVIDAVGNVVDHSGSAFNLGIGQLDVGQYDQIEPCFGPCFAAALVRRDAFELDHVGPLDESYYMYYEDVDWNWRANLFGYSFVTAPDARVHHEHSATARLLPLDYKYQLIQRNLLTTVLKNCERRGAARVWRDRFTNITRLLLSRKLRWANVTILLQALRAARETLHKRRVVQRRRRVHDSVVFRFSDGESPHFDAQRYAAEPTLANLAAMYRRKWLVTGDTRWRQVAESAAALGQSQLRFVNGSVTACLLPLLAGEPPYVCAFVREIEEACQSATLASDGPVALDHPSRVVGLT